MYRELSGRDKYEINFVHLFLLLVNVFIVLRYLCWDRPAFSFKYRSMV